MRASLFHNVIHGPVDPFDRVLSRMTGTAFAELIDRWMPQYDIVSWPEWMRRRESGSSRPSMLLTFDDGFAGVREVAFPILAERGLVATVFVLTRDGASITPEHLLHFEELELAFRHTTEAAFDATWAGLDVMALDTVPNRVSALRRFKSTFKGRPDAERAAATARAIEVLGVNLPELARTEAKALRYRKLSAAQIRELLEAGWTIGGHTRTHPVLARVDDNQLTDEIDGNARDLARAFSLTDVPFAYPFGGPDHVDARAITAVRQAGFACAFTTIPGQNTAGTDSFRLHRYSVTELQMDRLQWSSRPSLTGGDG